jgi:hypothetical protein
VIANLSKIAFGIEQFMQLIELALGSQVTGEMPLKIVSGWK